MNKNEERQIKRKKRIVNLLKKHPEGLGIEEIAKEIGVSRVTLARDLDNLIWKELKIVRRTIGAVKLHYHKDHARNIKGME